MQLSKAPPLRSRLLFLSFVTCCFLLFPWDSLRPYAFAYAADVDGSGVVSSEYDIGIAGQARAVEVLGDVDDTRLGEELGGEEAVGGNMDERGYRGDFAYFEPALVGRAPEGVDALKEGEKLNKQAKPGSVTYFVLERPKAKRRAKAEGSEQSSGEDTGGLETRQQRNQLYITVNACKLPTPVMLGTNDPPQLKLYVSTSAQNQKPGPKATNDLAGVVTLEGGAANFTVQGADTDVYLGVESPSLAAGWEGDFRFEVAVSSDKPYHSNVDNEPFLYMVDTDSDSALFITHNLTALGSSKDSIEKWLKVPKPEIPFQMYAFPNSAWGAKGLERSVCGIKDAFGTNSSNVRVDASMTDRYGGEGDDKLPKAQFHVQGLQRGTEYNGFLLIDGEAIEGLPLENRLGDLGRGGRVWRKFNWTTKADDSCQVIFDLDFCSTVAHAVPSSPDFKTNTTALAEKYDKQASAYYANFEKSLAQFPCNTTSTAQYSLARTCDDCARDYKSWLCAVLMPRCEDYSAPDPWLQPRNIGAKFANGSTPFIPPNQQNMRGMEPERWGLSRSRNPMIDTDIKPGPYKELLPCEDLCFDIVRSCPAGLGFACPVSDMMKRQQYGTREAKDGRDRRKLRCSFPGAVVDLNTARSAGAKQGLSLSLLVAFVVAAVLSLVL